jgi:hypothetical protein
MQHYTRNTVEASAWCRKCNKNTMHRIDGVKLGPCLACLHKPTEKKPEPKPLPAQPGLFGESDT